MTRAEWGAIGALALGLVPFAMAFGVAASTAGLSATSTMLLSIVVYAGASQFSALGVLASGGSGLLALITVYLVNLRFVPLGLSMPADTARTWRERLIAGHLLIDPSIALAFSTTPARRRRMFYVSGVVMYLLWIAGTAIGLWAGEVVGDPALLGLDAALPCAFIAILARWRAHAPTRRAIIGGAALTTVGLLLGPPTLAVPLGVTGALAGLPTRAERRQARANGEEPT